MSLHAIEPTRQRRADGVEARRADGVGRPKFDFHTGSDQPDPALVEASLDADVENALPIAQPRTPAGNVDESVDVVVCVEINQCVGCYSRRRRGRAGPVERCGTGIATPSSRRRVDGVERAVKF